MRFAAALLLSSALALLAQKVHDTCAPCHGEQVTDFKTHPHFAKSLSCDTCHGTSEKHRAATGAAPPDRVAAPDEQPAMCGTCHVSQRKDFEASSHGKVLLSKARTKAPSCGTCHGVHAVRAAAAIETSCNRCHQTLPESCKATSTRKVEVRCMGCHQTHLLAVTAASSK